METKLTASDGASFGRFGGSVALSDSSALVGAIDKDGHAPESGSAYLFDGRTGAQLPKLTASDGAVAAQFGVSVALDGATAVVGAPLGGGGAGAVHVYDLSPTWTALFGGAYDDADNWGMFAPGFDPGFDARIDPDIAQTITGPAGASEVGTLYLGHGDGLATLELQRGGGIIAGDGVEIGANGRLQGAGGIVGDIRNAGEIGLDGLALTGGIENVGLVEDSGRVGDLTNMEGGDLRNAGVLQTRIGSTTTIVGDYSGAGSTTGGDTLIFEGNVSTGASPSLVRFTDTVLETTARTCMEIGGTARGTGYDAWDVDRVLTLGGTLVLELLPGFEARPGQYFSLFSATDKIEGGFTSVDFASLSEGMWQVVSSETEYGVGVLAPVPLPAGA